MAVESQECFCNRTLESQIYTILKNMEEGNLATGIPSEACFKELTLDDQLYVLYENVKNLHLIDLDA
jgi:hypothetical protein